MVAHSFINRELGDLNCNVWYILPGFTDLKILKRLWQAGRYKNGGVIKKCW